MSDAKQAHVVLSVDDENLDRFAEVVGRLESLGLVVDDALEILGTVAGRIDPERFAEIERVPGVAAVERSRRPGIAPPESDLQ